MHIHTHTHTLYDPISCAYMVNKWTACNSIYTGTGQRQNTFTSAGTMTGSPLHIAKERMIKDEKGQCPVDQSLSGWSITEVAVESW